ncbi:MAG: N-acetylmuramic acid 6-phosphate etherase [Psychroflexus halocasei]|uniref:N-acetylmuramic acid 6-phosphate etherase n=1 Tax=Psychroflexus sp. S27 TaxID=1982757 RepID=UPI000C29A02E|nr:N-acetylmuramic acid 6-phosphate etherase [Psychroflexus sp. S27]PJX24512.1 N-acetylmuramic acid 6-phosphate etherase [Psychroflexus sp. S27]
MSDFIKITEQDSLYNDIEKMSTTEMLTNINNEDQKVALAVQRQIPMISKFIDVISEKLSKGGRLFYIGAGTSGRLGILDASECPPTFGVDSNMVIGLIAGGDEAIRIAVENAEDDKKQAIKDLEDYKIDQLDVVIGIAASGTTPYVIGGLEDCQNKEIVTACITCNKNSPVSQFSDFPIEVIVGPEFITGSSRMKAGTAQKMVLNMISTSVMIKLGRVKDNKMVDMQLSNQKLIERGSKMISEALNLNLSTSEELLRKHGSVRKAIDNETH